MEGRGRCDVVQLVTFRRSCVLVWVVSLNHGRGIAASNAVNLKVLVNFNVFGRVFEFFWSHCCRPFEDLKPTLYFLLCWFVAIILRIDPQNVEFLLNLNACQDWLSHAKFNGWVVFFSVVGALRWRTLTRPMHGCVSLRDCGQPSRVRTNWREREGERVGSRHSFQWDKMWYRQHHKPIVIDRHWLYLCGGS